MQVPIVSVFVLIIKMKQLHNFIVVFRYDCLVVTCTIACKMLTLGETG